MDWENWSQKSEYLNDEKILRSIDFKGMFFFCIGNKKEKIKFPQENFPRIIMTWEFLKFIYPSSRIQ